MRTPRTLRSQLRTDLPGELTVHVTDPAGFTADLLEAFSGIDGILLVAFGVLLDTVVVRTLLVPALAHDLAPVLWWPSRYATGSAGGPRRTEPDSPGGPVVNARRAS